MEIVRLVMSMGMGLGLSFSAADVKVAYTQSGEIIRKVHVRLPCDCYRRRGIK